MNLFLTADVINYKSGGGIVTHNELEAFKQLGPCVVWDASVFRNPPSDNVWGPDEIASKGVKVNKKFDLCHCYSGCFSNTIQLLKQSGCKITYMAAAHDIEKSRREHEKLGIPYNFPHLTDPQQWSRYLQGYLDADVLVVPSSHSRDVMRRYGRSGRIEIIPHGVDLPATIPPLPKTFTVGYLGAIGPDKGLIYLLQAWKKLNYSDAVLILAGEGSVHPWMTQLIRQYGGGSIIQRGWVNHISDFYNDISLLVQPSISEGFGLEVLEAMAHGRSVIASDGCGASELCKRDWDPPGSVFEAGNVDQLCQLIQEDKDGGFDRKSCEEACLEVAEEYTWDKIRERYIKLWKEPI